MINVREELAQRVHRYSEINFPEHFNIGKLKSDFCFHTRSDFFRVAISLHCKFPNMACHLYQLQIPYNKEIYVLTFLGQAKYDLFNYYDLTISPCPEFHMVIPLSNISIHVLLNITHVSSALTNTSLFLSSKINL